MAKISDIYKGGGNFLSAKLAEELELYQNDLQIRDAEVREIREDKKVVVSFEDIEELLPLNVTNARILQEALGDETDNWKGEIIQLLPVKRNFQGKMVDAIQVMVVGQKKLEKKRGNGGGKSTPTPSSSSSSDDEQEMIKKAVADNTTIKEVVDDLTLFDDNVSIRQVVDALKQRVADSNISRKEYTRALEHLI